MVTAGAIRRAKLQSKCHDQQINICFILQAGYPLCVTLGLASHWPCITDTMVYPSTGWTANDREMSIHTYDSSKRGTIYLFTRYPSCHPTNNVKTLMGKVNYYTAHLCVLVTNAVLFQQPQTVFKQSFELSKFHISPALGHWETSRELWAGGNETSYSKTCLCS